VTSGRLERRLAAILAADVVGYSRLMGADEVGTLAALKAIRRDIVDAAIAAHNGRIVKTTGDGLLVEFASVVDAVTCAMTVQGKLAEHNSGKAQAINFRIGINVGDIIIDGDDIFGDGVNIAARVETECLPGAVFLSDDAFRQVRGKTSFAFDDVGDRALKNIDRPVRLYAVRMAGAVPRHVDRKVRTLPIWVSAAAALVIATVGGWIAWHSRVTSGQTAAATSTVSAQPGASSNVSPKSPSASVDARREIVFKRMVTAMHDDRFGWRTIERLAIDSGVDEAEAHEILAEHPDEVILGKSHDGKLVARLSKQ
jgi:class 3 adenylate cyclase